MLVEEFGGDVNATDDNQCTPLHWLARLETKPPQPDHDVAIDMLVELGADLEARTKTGETAVMIYSVTGSVASLRRPLDHGRRQTCAALSASRL